ncbi:methionine--tRNA ligase [Zavarzinella formosa]|uniref:methionine--tRNA ligase n=1 Tax=Zavarzinella formosa TaxID=360055 RepID=UPI0003102DC8|nr:methionine--tRNA ligase [Zavarzinella formosa]
MSERPRWFQTTAIDYPNSRPHIGTAFEKLGADVQARYRRMEGYDVWFLMGNDENTLKVADRAKELGLDPQAYCDDMARQFREVWDALDISYDVFIQTSHERHKACCRKFIQKVYDNGHIYKGAFEGWYCAGCEEFKSDKVHEANAGNCPIHKRPLIRRSEPCYYFKLSAFKDRLLEFLKNTPDFVQPESRRNEMIGFIEAEGLNDLNISRSGESWGLRLPFDPDYTVYVWFDALLTYITGIGYGDDEATFRKFWPADIHFIGKDITRFHSHIWPAMLWAAGEEAPKQVFSHGFVTVDGTKMGKSMGNVVQPLDIIAKSNVDAYRYFFLRECAYPSDGDYSGQRYEEVFNSELANNLGNLLSRCITVVTKSFDSVLPETANWYPKAEIAAVLNLLVEESTDVPGLRDLVESVRKDVETCRYNLCLRTIIDDICTPANRVLDGVAPWKLVKTGNPGDKFVAKQVLFRVIQVLRMASILLKPFIPRSAETIYTSFNFPKPWAEVTYADAAELKAQPDDLRVTAELIEGKVKPLFPRLA